MKRFFKWIGILLGGLIGLVLLAGVVLYFIGTRDLAQRYTNVAVEKISIPTGAEAIARGKHIATIWSCTKCHGEDLGGRVITRDPLIGQIPFMVAISASNLTAGKGGIGGSYSNTDWVRAIRHGVMPDNEVEVYMYGYFSTMSDGDLGDLIAYIKQVLPVDSQLPSSNYGPIFPILAAAGPFKPEAELIDQGAPHRADVTPGVTREYGQYLSVLCTACHPNAARELQSWNQTDFVHTFHRGVLPNGTSFGSTMSSKTFKELDDTELDALWLYFEGPKSSK